MTFAVKELFSEFVKQSGIDVAASNKELFELSNSVAKSIAVQSSPRWRSGDEDFVVCLATAFLIAHSAFDYEIVVVTQNTRTAKRLLSAIWKKFDRWKKDNPDKKTNKAAYFNGFQTEMIAKSECGAKVGLEIVGFNHRERLRNNVGANKVIFLDCEWVPVECVVSALTPRQNSGGFLAFFGLQDQLSRATPSLARALLQKNDEIAQQFQRAQKRERDNVD